VLAAEIEDRHGALELSLALEITDGACLALAGPSGAGKTTTLRILAGLRRPERGVVRCGPALWLDTAAGVDLPPERRRCGLVFQDYALFGNLSARRNVEFALTALPRVERRARALEMLDRFGLASRAGARPASLSGGERQRLALARALALEPSVLLLDEPLSALDPRTRARAGGRLHGALRESGAPAVLVTHDFAQAAWLADEVAVIDGGRIVQRGSASELASSPATAFVADFTGAVVLRGVASSGPDGLTRVQLDGGGETVSTDRAEGPVALSIHPWEVTLTAAGNAPEGSARNLLAAEVSSVTQIGPRARVGLAGAQPLTAEVTLAAVRDLGLRPGARVIATWKASATRLLRD